MHRRMPAAYKLYKGLQRPLVFKMFRGRYIYWAGGALVGSVGLGIILAATTSSVTGLLTLAIAGTVSLMWVINKQKRGLYHKNIQHGTYMMHSFRHVSRKITIRFES